MSLNIPQENSSRRASLQVEVFSSISSIPYDTRTALAPDLQFILGEQFTAGLESAMPDFKFSYLLAKSETRPVGLITFYEFTVANIRVVVCGHPLLCADTGIRTGRAHNSAVLDNLLPHLKNLLAEKKVYLFIVKDTTIDSHIWKKHGFFNIPGEPALAIEESDQWCSFDDYVSCMRSKYRKKILNTKRNFANNYIEITEFYNNTDLGKIHEAYMNVLKHTPKKGTHEGWLNFFLSNAPRKMGVRDLSVEFFSDFIARFPREIDILVLRKGGEILGHTINVYDCEVYYSLFVGIANDADYIDTYRQLLTTKVEKAISRNSKKITFGRTATITKLDFGAIQTETHWWGWCPRRYLQFVNPILSKVFQLVPKTYAPHRNVFRKTTSI